MALLDDSDRPLDKRVQHAAMFWDQYAKAGLREKTLLWDQLPQVAKYIRRKVTGSEDRQIWPYFIEKYFPDGLPVTRLLNLGCGTDDLGHELASLHFFESCDAVDISERALDVARRTSAEQGFNINYSRADLNRMSIAPDTYSAVVAKMSLHHVDNLESLLKQVNTSLCENGVAIFSEYVGPDRFQFSDEEVDLIDAAIACLPDNYLRLNSQSNAVQTFGRGFAQRVLARVRTGQFFEAARRRFDRMVAAKTGTPAYWRGYARKTIEEVMVDPSEAIHSSQILPLAERHLQVIDVYPWGGTILHHGIGDIIENFADSEPGSETDKFLRMLIFIEDKLLELGVIESHFAYIVAQKR